jgi:hypothetical protein
MEQQRFSRVPHVPVSHADKVRRGFTDPATLDKIAANLPDVLADVVRFAYVSAWRRSEVVGLT